jgi:thiol:disulfide interchange protein DsbD
MTLHPINWVKRLLPAYCALLCLLGGALTAAAGSGDADPFARGNQAPTPVAGKPTDAKEPGDAKFISFTVELSAGTVRRGETVQLKITGTPAPGYHTYPLTQRADNPEQAVNQLSKLVFDDTAGLQPLFPVEESQPQWEKLEGLGLFLVHGSQFSWAQQLAVPADEPPGSKVIRFHVHLQVCNDQRCLQPTDHHFEVPFTVSDGPAVVVAQPLAPQLSPPAIKNVPIPSDKGGPTPSAPTAEPPARSEAPAAVSIADTAQEHKAGLDAVLRELQGQAQTNGSTSTGGLLSFALQGVFWGLVSLLTPCVFPMIPITVSFFLKQSEKQHHRPVTLALVYSGTIVTVLTIAAVALLSFFRWLSVNPLMNLALGALFIYFALSLFGMYDIELPSFLTRFTSARESRGGLVGTVFMALTFTMVSFACVAPFLGGFGGTAAGSGITIWHRLVGGVAFAASFAAPFFLLALFPQLLKRLPKSGSWMNSVKVIMGVLEFAAALKFLRAGELVLLPRATFLTYDLVLGMYVALAVVAGLYLLNLFRLPHDSPNESVGVPRFVLGVLFLSLGLYLAPALFKLGADGQNQRPNGTLYAWVDSFLLPEPAEGREGNMAWTGNLKAALEEARKAAESGRPGERKLVFVDFTGETCTNCKLNERDVFSRPDIKDLLLRYRIVKLYTDKVPNAGYSEAVRSQFGFDVSRQRADAAANLAFQKAAFDAETLPTYVILDPQSQGSIKVVGKNEEGRIIDAAAFAEFLRKPLESETR